MFKWIVEKAYNYLQGDIKMELPQDLRDSLVAEMNQVVDLGALIYTRGYDAGVAAVEPGFSQEEMDAAVQAAVAAKKAEFQVWWDTYNSEDSQAFNDLMSQ